MTASPETVAYIKQVVAYYHDPANAPHDDPPKPPSVEVAMDASAAVAKVLGLILEYQKTGQLPGMEPSPEFRLAAAELIEQYTNQQEEGR